MKNIQERLIVELFHYHNMENNQYWYLNLNDETEDQFCSRNYYNRDIWFSLREGLIHIFKQMHKEVEALSLEEEESFHISHNLESYDSRYTVEYIDW